MCIFRDLLIYRYKVKKRLRRINSPCPLIHEGVYYFQLLLYNVAMNILQQIFSDHYEEIKYTLKTRPVVLESIEKMIHCGAPSFGGAMYGCPSCGALKFVPFRCKSRFFPSCGNLYSIQRTTSMSLSSFSAFIGIVSLPSPKKSVSSSVEIVLCLIASFIPFATLSFTCSAN